MDTQSKVMTVAIEAFCQYGFKTITMEEIAKKAGISKKTLYQHFASKPEMVAAAMKWHGEQMDADLQRVTDEAENSLEAMVRVNALILKMYRQINPIALLELERFFPLAWKSFREKLMKQDIGKIRDSIVRGQAEGLYRAELDANLLACYRLETCLVAFRPNSLLAQQYAPYAASQAILEHFLHGLLTPKGQKLYNKYADKYLKETSRI